MLLNLTTPALAEAAAAAEGSSLFSTENLIVLTNVLLFVATMLAVYFTAKDGKTHATAINASDNERAEVEQAALLKHEDREEARLAHIIHEVLVAEHEAHETPAPALTVAKDEPAA